MAIDEHVCHSGWIIDLAGIRCFVGELCFLVSREGEHNGASDASRVGFRDLNARVVATQDVAIEHSLFRQNACSLLTQAHPVPKEVVITAGTRYRTAIG